MKKLMIVVASLATLASTGVMAQSYSYTYAAAAGTDNSGSFTVANTNGTYSLTAFAGTVAGVSYNLSNVALGDAGLGEYYLGGLLNGVDQINSRTNDFYQNAQFTPGALIFTDSFYYSAVNTSDFFDTPTVTFRQVVASAAVPEPAAWGMMILGIGVIGFAMRRQKVTTRVSYAA